jgi:thimet oligopeptidase
MRPMPFDYAAVTADDVRRETDAALAIADEHVSRAVASAAHSTLRETLVPLELAGAELIRAYGIGAFLGQSHPDAAVRDAGIDAEERLTKWRVALPFRRDLHEAVEALASSNAATTLTGEDARLLAHWRRDFHRAGQGLPDTARAELEGVRARLVEIGVAFQRNLNDYRDGIDVTRDDLAGLPESYVERLSAGDRPGTYRVSLDYPELNPFLELADRRDLRRELFEKSWSKAVPANRRLLEEALDLRRRAASLLGEPTWAHHAMEVKMARSPDRVESFYATLLPTLRDAVAADVRRLEDLLVADGHEPPLRAWDWRYYDQRLLRTEYGVDHELVSEYLSLDDAIAGMFELTGSVFGLTYHEVPDPRAWHPSVRLYEIRDRETDAPIAHFYADLHPRPGKYTHAAAFPIVVGHEDADGRYVPPVNAILANFTPPSGDRPALLKHSELETLFHEFGHILHMSLTRARYARFSGGETEWDFVEAPSQIMEHWVWEPSVLRGFARHHATGEPIPLELVEQLRRARWVNVGIKVATQAFYGAIDLALHASSEVPELDEALRRTYEVTGLPYPDGTFMLSGFDHLLGGYDAGYYGYLWAEVIGDDMFGRFVREGITSPSVGLAYRRAVLEPNGSRDGEELVRSFLGRDPSNEAFLTLRGMR